MVGGEDDEGNQAGFFMTVAMSRKEFLIHGHMLVLINTRSLKSQPFKFTKVVSVSWVEIDWGLWRAYRTGVAAVWLLCAMHRTPQDIGLLGTMEGQSLRPRELSK